MGLHEIEILCKAKETVSIMKRQPSEWETFATIYMTGD